MVSVSRVISLNGPLLSKCRDSWCIWICRQSSCCCTCRPMGAASFVSESGIETPDTRVERMVQVYHNLAKWEYFCPLTPAYTYVSPKLGCWPTMLTTCRQ